MPDCNKKYIGQIDRPFHIRFQEHFHNYDNGNNKFKFAQHLLGNKHSIGPMVNIMDIIHTMNEGKVLDSKEKFYIYKEARINNQINDKCPVKPNIVFDTLILKDTDRAQTTP
jgi:hypothetical protein